MACFHPISAWQGPNGGPVSFKPAAYHTRYLEVPCGQCVGCRLERSRQWAVRCAHEASCWEFNSFLTLTYRDEDLPPLGSLRHSDFQKFMKRLRDRLGYPAMRFYMCGEYGETLGRPHYHALLFGIDFPDKVHFRDTMHGHRLYTSVFLDEVWGLGHCQIGSVSFESAAYVARYVMKKNMGRNTAPGVRQIDPVTGEVLDERVPEYNCMSRGSGIGSDFLARYHSDIFPRDFAMVNGVKFRPPRYYDNRYEVVAPEVLERVKARRRERALLREAENSPDRLLVREELQLLKQKRIHRSVG